MRESDIEKLAIRVAELVLDGLLEKQKEWDQQFTADVGKLMRNELGTPNLVSQEELILAEMARLMTLMASYEEKEQYEKAAIVKRKIEILQNKLNNL
jgi:protein-arginine kinase activator protein McsA|tara:strand:+ start:458 stop:748 length:291 start_codon:yes stop_codon:yes gene_type:complete